MPVDPSCPVCRTADVVCSKWTLLLVRELAGGATRFSELERALTGISPRTLSLRLRLLEDEEIVARTDCDYVLTDKGLALLPIVESLRAYGEQWFVAPVAPVAAAA
jgi:DNA-binding HxlR family transcriptional regulator